jgi:flagellar biosynthetic protein FliP
MHKKHFRFFHVLFCVFLVGLLGVVSTGFAQGVPPGRSQITTAEDARVAPIGREAEVPFPIPSISLQIDPAQNRSQLGTGLQILIVLTILSLAPSILMMLTSFTRTLIVLGFVRKALGTQQEPSNQIIIGLALFITFFTMSPVISQVYTDSVRPYTENQIDHIEAYNRAINPIRAFMFKHVRQNDLEMFIGIESNRRRPASKEEVSTLSLIPAFVTSELRTAFQMGVVIYLPFLVIDMVVSSILMSMGMMMLPPAMISMPFKILLFVLVDGWNLVIKSIVISFGGNA